MTVADKSTRPAPSAREGIASLPRKPGRVIVQYLRFVVVGLSNAVVDLGMLNLLLYLWPTRDPLILIADNTVAVMLAILNSYLWNTRWTFHALVTGSVRERALFVAQGILNVLLNNAVLLALTLLLQPTPGVGYLVASNVAKLCAMLTASSTSFVILRTIVFRHR